MTTDKAAAYNRTHTILAELKQRGWRISATTAGAQLRRIEHQANTASTAPAPSEDLESMTTIESS